VVLLIILPESVDVLFSSVPQVLDVKLALLVLLVVDPGGRDSHLFNPFLGKSLLPFHLLGSELVELLLISLFLFFHLQDDLVLLCLRNGFSHSAVGALWRLSPVHVGTYLTCARGLGDLAPTALGGSFHSVGVVLGHACL
jgi:hypothetical protein